MCPKQKSLQTLALLFFAGLSGVSMAQIVPDPTVPAGYSLIWSDEFNQTVGKGADIQTWNYATGKNNANNELEIYTIDPRNISIQKNETSGKPYLAITAIQDGDYYSARINTKGNKSFQYGYIEARIQLPYGQGIWPAFWMMGANDRGWPYCGEIDIMENIGKLSDQGTCHGSLHGPGYSGAHCMTGQYVLPHEGRFKDGYHIFAVLWEKDSIQFMCDGQVYEKRTPDSLRAGNEGWVFNRPFYLILNLAVGGGWPGNPDGSTSFPQVMKVDYVRVYQKPTSTPTP